MEKKYLLLRNNMEMGPFTLTELLRLRLRPTDLVWVEGKSLAWAYPTEISEVRAALLPHQEEPEKGPRRNAHHPAPKAKRFHRPAPQTDRAAAQASPPVVPLPAYIRQPSDEIERKAEELRQKVLSHDAGPWLHPRMPDGPEPSQTPPPRMADEIDFVYHRRPRSVSVSQVLVAVMIGAMLVVGWYGRPLLNAKKDTVNSVATKLVSTEEHKAAAPLKETAQSVPADSAKGTDSSVLARRAVPVKPKAGPQEMPKVNSASFAVPDSGLAQLKEEKKPEEEDTAVKEATGAPVAQLEKKEPETTTPKDEVEEEPADRKKGLGQALKSIFRGKKKKDREADDTMQAEVKDSTNE